MSSRRGRRSGRADGLTDNLLPKWGITTTTIDSRDNKAWEEAIRPNTKVFFFETPANPTMDIVDMAFVCGLAKRTGLRPWSIMPCDVGVAASARFGADVVAYSATKMMDGQGRVLAGAVAGSNEFINENCCRFSAIPGRTCRRSTPGWC